MDPQPLRKHSDGYLSDLARHLDEPGTFGKLILWIKLSSGRMPGFRFEHDHPVAGYTLDFYCPAIRLGIEVVAGPSYADRDAVETRRSTLEAHGVILLSFTEEEIQEYTEDVLEHIRILCSAFDRMSQAG